MLTIITFVIATLIVMGAHFGARKFVRERLRYVDAIHKPGAPWIAGIIAAILLIPVVALLPLVGIGTALSIGLAIGTGVSAGAREVKRGFSSLERID